MVVSRSDNDLHRLFFPYPRKIIDNIPYCVYVQLNQTGKKEFSSLIRNALQKTIGTFIAMVQRVFNSFQDDFLCDFQNPYLSYLKIYSHKGMGQNLVPLVNLKMAGKWMFMTLKMVLIGIDP